MKKIVRKSLPINFLFRCLDSSTDWKPVRIKMRETVLITYCSAHDFCQAFRWRSYGWINRKRHTDIKFNSYY